jgi:hypothetical protein
MTYFDGKTLNLRQGCQLVAVPDKPMTRTLVFADGAEKPFEIDRDSALAYAVGVANEFGVGEDRTDATFIPQLAKAALKKTKKDEEDANK